MSHGYYTKKIPGNLKYQVVVEAFQFGVDEPWEMLPVWFRDKVNQDEIIPHPGGGCYIKNLEGAMKAEVGDMIIKGIHGELYPCKKDIFDASYEVYEGE